MQIGMELELWTIDPSGSLASAEPLLDCDGVDPECIDSLVEIKTPPCRTVLELQTALLDRLETVFETAAAHDRRLVPVATPLFEDTLVFRDSPRTRIQQAVLGDDFRYCACAGVHIHFEQVDPISQLNLLTALDPAIALVTSSPYFDGSRICRCARPAMYRRSCYRRFPGHGRLWRYADDIDEWRVRIEERFAAFRAAAVRSGFDASTFDDHFEPETTVWSPVRLRDDLGTVEWRAPDSTHLEPLFRFIARVIDIIERGNAVGVRVGDGPIADQQLVIPPFHSVREVVDDTIQNGLMDANTREYLTAFGFEPEAYQPVSHRIDNGLRLSADAGHRIRRQLAQYFEFEVGHLRDRLPIEPEQGIVPTPPM